ncbi:serine hydrolase domain-containing protein [Streptomyces sp. NPDC093109]|uniref:serine hydrolase domain-containing protein n=1 Tax=Streptomyces sp. NPDC093109 TaxID=3154977 RepID=UPI00345050C2
MTARTIRNGRAARGTRGTRLALTGALAAVAVAGTAFTAPAAVAAPAPGGTGPGHSATRKALDALVEEGVPGVAAQVKDDRGVWKGASGVGDRTTNAPRRAEDRYRVGSTTKTFVATVLLQLEAEGRLDLDDTVDRHLPGLVRGNGNDGRKITLRQLLNHTSGIYNYTTDPGVLAKITGDGFLQHRYDTWKPRQLVAAAMTHAPDFAPGKGWNYSNTNFILAGMVIEKTTGRPYGTEVERRIIRPLGLRATTVPVTDPTVPGPASRAYSTLGLEPSAPVHDATEQNPSWAGAAGAIISDSADLNRFYRALLKGELLPRKQLKEMTTTVPTPEVGPSFGYGLGLYRQTLSCGTEVWGHNGGIHGSLSTAVTTRDGRHSLAMNLNGDWAGDSTTVLEAEFCG